ncbi:MAG: hypothetical protein EOP53_12645 [Sphingobacteriales bacterium]|nr:MAG: hypothetical protein EOP53_12645 [Sphingobacteriales bacterium]
MLSIVKKQFLFLSILFAATVFMSSCKKETIALKPNFIEQPKFYVEADLKGTPLNLYSGQNKFVAAPKIDEVNLMNLSIISVYSSNITNGTDSFQVGFMDLQFPRILPVLPSKEALNKLLENAQKPGKDATLFSDYPGVTVRWSTSNAEYTSPGGDVQNGSNFHIIKVEDYTPPGADHAMKKVDVTFRCLMKNDNNEFDVFWLENGRATLLFDYKVQ